MKMTAEQFMALWDAVVRHVTYTIDDHENGHNRDLWLIRNRAHEQARRLLVEPEQAKPIHNGECVGGPMHGKSVSSESAAVEFPSASGEVHRYEWQPEKMRWDYCCEQPEPDLTTFGELQAGSRFECTEDELCKGMVFRKTEDFDPSQDRNAMNEQTGRLWTLSKHDPVRRLPTTEFKR